jgi:rhodanese-related sulfurtransferase
VFTWVFSGLPEFAAQENTMDSLETVKEHGRQGGFLIDVREKLEWDVGHLRNAASLPLSELPENLSGGVLAKRFPRGQILYLRSAAGAADCKPTT